MSTHRFVRPFASRAVHLSIFGSLAVGLGASLAACGADSADTNGLGGASTTGDTTGSGGASTTSTSTSQSTSTSSTSTSTSQTPACTSDDDCTVGAMKVCDLAKSECVECVAGGAGDTCHDGEICTPEGKCEMGCETEDDCAPPLTCDPVKKKCTGCAQDADCPPGSVCSSETCVAGCSDEQGCQLGKLCCNKQCSDFDTDPANCGSCGHACPSGANGAAACTNGTCGLACASGFADCNGDPSDGCERNTLQDGACTCVAGATESCYGGAPGTEGVGPCKAGVRTCDAKGSKWGPCVGQVLPVAETQSCNNGKDDDCNGLIDDVPDLDGDGWTKCDGDCCDSISDGCSEPTLVNPGAFDAPGNTIDDDCDGTVDNGQTTCDAALVSNSATATDYAKAIDLCAKTTANPPLAEKKWGVISAGLHLADGIGAPNPAAKSIRAGFGSGVTALKGSKLVVLSTGNAAAPGDTSPDYVAFQGGKNMLKTSPVPADWLAANGGAFPNAPGCPSPAVGNTANDPVMLKIRVRVPTNAKSFNVSSFFYSSEYPEWVCSKFNDFFLTLLDSTFTPGLGETPNPADKNLAFYKDPSDKIYPVGVNLAFGNTGLFKACMNGPTGCGSSAVVGTMSTCADTTQLAGTGFDAANPPSPYNGEEAWCGASNLTGGGTGWLTTSGNVTPGETIDVRFVIWDTSDHLYDSVALLDNFEWSLNAAEPGTHN